MLKSVGNLLYSDDPYKLIVSVDDEIGKFYRSLVPKYLAVKKPMYPTHISVVRNQMPVNLSAWRKYHEQEIVFDYDSYIYNDELYYWLNAYSKSLEDIRVELGLPSTSKYTRSPDGRHMFHITIGNLK
jgi:uncharacterized protein YaeQ